MIANKDEINSDNINNIENQDNINNEERNNNIQNRNDIDEEDKTVNIDEIIKKLYPFENKPMSQRLKNEKIKIVSESNLLSEEELKYLCNKSMEIFM